MKKWTAIYIEKHSQVDKWHWVYLTNCDPGYIDGRIAITQGIGSYQEVTNLFGKCRVCEEDGRVISVYVNGEPLE